jgi:hypothetical protein
VPKIGQFANQSAKLSVPMAVWPLTWLIVIGFNRQVAGSL